MSPRVDVNESHRDISHMANGFIIRMIPSAKNRLIFAFGSRFMMMDISIIICIMSALTAATGAPAMSVKSMSTGIARYGPMVKPNSRSIRTDMNDTCIPDTDTVCEMPISVIFLGEEFSDGGVDAVGIQLHRASVSLFVTEFVPDSNSDLVSHCIFLH